MELWNILNFVLIQFDTSGLGMCEGSVVLTCIVVIFVGLVADLEKCIFHLEMSRSLQRAIIT